MSSVDENCSDPDLPCSLPPSVISSLASSLGATHTVTVAPDAATGSSHHSTASLTVGAEVGIAVGAVCLLVIVVSLLVVLLRRRRRRGKHVVELDLGDPSSPIMTEAAFPHFPRLPGESVTSLVGSPRDVDTGRPSGHDGAVNAERATGPSGPQSGLRSAKAVAMSEKRQAARDARNESRPGVVGRDGVPLADRSMQAVQYETDGGIRIAGGRLRPTSKHGDDQHGGSGDAGRVLPPPYAEY
ncbi:hypothetical protein LXA43DRAFT_1135981 [Ganoderma leucocontextum]|nr:hypothetical protein LXA43DRAFT_1135981 [Ganoderma leucocontextum]